MRTKTFQIQFTGVFCAVFLAMSAGSFAQEPNGPALAPADAAATVADNWWHPFVTRTARVQSNPVELSLEDVLIRALQHSDQIRVFSDLPLIRETAVIEADASFDWSAFLDSRWDDLSDPVGNTLTTGGASRFEDHQASLSYGGRKRTRNGGSLEVAQDHGWQRNNSIFFQPNPQATSRLRLSYTQPLLRGSGKVYNESLVVLAKIDSQIATAEFRRQLQSHLLEVIRGYWSLYLERALLVQNLRSFYRAQKTVDRLELRRELDAVDSQIASARAALKTREAEVIRARTNVRNAEARLRALVNDPSFALERNAELIPMDPLSDYSDSVDVAQAMSMAIQHRPEVHQALKQIRSACTREQMSRNELLPALNLVTEAYLAGLRPDEQFIGSVREQFSYQPGYSIGLQFEVPLGNRAAKANRQRRAFELRQLKNQYQTTLETLRLEVEIAVRNVAAGKPELDAKREAMLASQQRLDYLQKRWQHLPGADLTASLALENLLAAQTDLMQSEAAFMRSLVTYNLAQSSLLHATGLLLQEEQVAITRRGSGIQQQIVAHKPRIHRMPQSSMYAPPVPAATPQFEVAPQFETAPQFEVAPQFPTQPALEAPPVQRVPTPAQRHYDPKPPATDSLPATPMKGKPSAAVKGVSHTETANPPVRRTSDYRRSSTRKRVRFSPERLRREAVDFQGYEDEREREERTTRDDRR